MKFYKEIWNRSFGDIHDKVEYPCIIVENNGWDDFGYKTLFQLYYCKENFSNKEYLGEVKILSKISKTTVNNISESFEYLDENFCSLGQSIDYYRSISKLDENIRTFILKGLNDVVYSDEFYNEFYHTEGFKTSLLRSSEASRIVENRKALIENIDFKGRNKFKFDYVGSLKYSDEEIVLNVDFSDMENLQDINRINVIVGKNGTGKTSILSDMAKSICYGEWSRFSDKPNFSKVISLSYSIFDDFFNPNFEKTLDEEKIKDNKYKQNSEFNYIYCGIRDGLKVLSTDELEEKLNYSLDSIINKGRTNQWKKILKELFENNYSYFVDKVFENRSISQLSSGQSMLVVSFTEVIANIENESLILFDEPETHLHPNAISNLMRMINKLLDEFNSYCIITTHSPMIVQEIPAKYVKVIERIDDMACIKKLTIESFGENITNIINDVFRVSNSESNYKYILEKIYDNGLTIEEIQSNFDYNLSFNAITFLNILDDIKRGV